MSDQVRKRSSSTREFLRQSGKRVDQMMMGSQDQFITATVTKEGSLFLHENQKKWKPLYFLLCGGVIYWKQRESSTSIKGEIPLKNSSIEKTSSLTVDNQTIFPFTITVDDKVYNLASEKESVVDDWIQEINHPNEKPTLVQQGSRKETRVLRAQKRVGGTIATSTAGKKIIKEALGTEGYRGISIIKRVITHVHGKKKATETEEIIIRLGVKVILLAKNKELTLADLINHREHIKSVCELLSHHAQFTFDYSSVTVRTEIETFKNELLKTLQRCFSAKNINTLEELLKFLTSNEMLDALFTDPALKESRKEWHYLMKNISGKLDLNWNEE